MYANKVYSQINSVILQLKDFDCPRISLCNFSFALIYKLSLIQFIPQETVVNNLGPDRLAGSKALDPNYCRQPTL